MLVKCPHCGKEFISSRREKREYDVTLLARMSLAVTNATGFGMKLLMDKCRKRDLVDVRSCVAMILLEEGVGVQGIADFIQREPSDVSWLLRRYENQRNDLEKIYWDIKYELGLLQV